MKRIFNVAIPIAGHAWVVVEADDEESAIELAFDEVTIDHIETWEPIRQFHEGNVCYCPRPWEAEATDEGPSEPDGEPA